MSKGVFVIFVVSSTHGREYSTHYFPPSVPVSAITLPLHEPLFQVIPMGHQLIILHAHWKVQMTKMCRVSPLDDRRSASFEFRMLKEQ